MMNKTPVIVLGGTGYVAGELLRLLSQHPLLSVAGVLSESRAGKQIHDTFPNLQHCYGDTCFFSRQEIFDLLNTPTLAVFSAAPHGASAGLIAELMTRAEKSGTTITVVDVSADFRYQDAGEYASVYSQQHGAPELLDQFVCALPEHLAKTPKSHVGHPGCFATALLLGIVPLLKLNLVTPSLYAMGITGSSGSGRSPAGTTHHPERHSNLYAYKALNHRHSPEVVNICESITGTRPALHFVPHSGPFARGIQMTIQATVQDGISTDRIVSGLKDFYADAEFVTVCDQPPRIKDVVGSNYCHLSAAVADDTVAVMVVIDNLIKGAAGGAIQWMNRQLGFKETTGLTAPGAAWV